MAGKTIHVDIVSAEGEIFAGDAEIVFVPAQEGELGITPRHAPLLTMIKAGEVRVKTAEGDTSVFVSGGALEIQPNQVTVLADTAIRAHDLDEAAALAAKQRAEEALAGKRTRMEIAEARAELARLAAQLKILQKIRNTRS